MVEGIFAFSSAIGRLTQHSPTAHPNQARPWFQPEHKAWLKSALIGGPWPQARLRAAGWSDQVECRLC